MIDPFIFAENLSEEELTTVGRVHPMLMGGDVLARVIMQSDTMHAPPKPALFADPGSRQYFRLLRGVGGA